MIAFPAYRQAGANMKKRLSILCVIGPTASGKSARGVAEALARRGEVISVDSRQVYRMLDIGTEKITPEEMQGVPHHLIDIRDPKETYSAGDFVADATRLIEDISARGKLPILVGGTHFYFDALLHGLPEGPDADPVLRDALAALSDEELFARVRSADPRRALELDPKNRRRSGPRTRNN
jgi:tRNA dimethylallyltransferase